jgi:hypothetical protein
MVANAIKKGKLRVGSTITDKGFVSTSLNNPFSGNVRMKINVPKGTPAIYINGSTKYTGEEEVLLPRDLPMRVKSINSNPYYHIIELEVINDK